jgi:hypothetical protein
MSRNGWWGKHRRGNCVSSSWSACDARPPKVSKYRSCFHSSYSLLIGCTLGLSFFARCVLLVVTHECTSTMVTYMADELRLLRRNYVTVTRPARKVIFRLRLWCPKRMRERRLDRCDAEIPTVIGNRRRTTATNTSNAQSLYCRLRFLRVVDIIDSCESSTRDTSRSTSLFPPTLYVFNAASIAKPNAIEQLTSELIGYDIDIGVISESHMKKKEEEETRKNKKEQEEARQQLC